MKGGFGEELLLQMIATRPSAFSLEPGDLLALKKAGVPDKVIGAMLGKK